MKLTICSENQDTAVEFKGRMSITFDHGGSAENFIFTPEMLRAALVKYADQIEDLRRMTRFVKKEMGVDIQEYETKDATPYQLCPKCLGKGELPAYSTTVNRICDLCNGSKVILMHRP